MKELWKTQPFWDHAINKFKLYIVKYLYANIKSLKKFQQLNEFRSRFVFSHFCAPIFKGFWWLIDGGIGGGAVMIPRFYSHFTTPKTLRCGHTSRTSAKVFFREGGHMSRWTTACGSWFFTASTPTSNHHHVTGPPFIRPGHSDRQKRGRKRGGSGPFRFYMKIGGIPNWVIHEHMDTNYKSASITDSTPRSCTSQI